MTEHIGKMASDHFSIIQLEDYFGEHKNFYTTSTLFQYFQCTTRLITFLFLSLCLQKMQLIIIVSIKMFNN